MVIKLNEILSTVLNEKYKHWETLTKGRFASGLNLYKGMPYFSNVRGRLPLINFHINPFKEDESLTPWRDLVFQDEGRVVYNGDNKSSTTSANSTFGNKKILEVLPLYFSKNKSDRLKAPPILVTQTVKINNKTGYRKFIGIGIISESPKLVQQYEKGTDFVFSNYQFVVSLFALSTEDTFDWEWIDERRDSSLDDERVVLKAPKSWKKWVEFGNEILPDVKLNIKSYRVISEDEQREIPLKNNLIIKELLNVHYPDPIRDGIRFEAMASFIATLFFDGQSYQRGWITVGTGDRGVDFVGRLDIGHDSFSSTSIIVLGQSKRYKNSISGERLTRVASRMTRGYIGLVITLDTFTRQAQQEIKDDKLPIILINGKKVSELLLNHMNKNNKTLKELVDDQDIWAKSNLGTLHYDSILNY